MTAVRLTERIAFPAGQKVRREGTYPVIESVLLCGAESANRRRYKPAAFGKGKLYEGKPVFIDHTDARTGRKYQDQIGWVEKEARDAQGRPVGDIGIKPTHPLAESVLWDAEHKPTNCGMSHVALCETKRGKDGWEEVESISRVESVDIVIGPATTKSLYEQTSREGTGVKTTLRAVIESLREKLPAAGQAAARKLLLVAEDDAAMGAMMDAPVDAPDAAVDPDEAIDDAFKQAMHAQVDALLADSHTLPEFITKCRELFKSRAKILDKPAPEGDGGGDDKPPAAESRKPIDPATVIAECKAAKFAPTYEQGEHLRNIPEADTRKVVIESWKAATTEAARQGEQPRSAGRHQANGAAGTGGKVKESAAGPTDAKAFARMLTG